MDYLTLFFWILLWLRYGLVWITTTLVFVLAALGNCATFLMQKRSDHGTAWSFDVSYVNVAAGSVYGYAILVPMAFYFSLQYLGSNSSLIRFWCLWGYSLFIFILASVSFWNPFCTFILFFYPLDIIHTFLSRIWLFPYSLQFPYFDTPVSFHLRITVIYFRIY